MVRPGLIRPPVMARRLGWASESGRVDDVGAGNPSMSGLAEPLSP